MNEFCFTATFVLCISETSNVNRCCAVLKAFLRHANLNPEGDENTNLMHQLQEKQRRHERYMRTATMFSPRESRVGSTEDIARKLRILHFSL